MSEDNKPSRLTLKLDSTKRRELERIFKKESTVTAIEAKKGKKDENIGKKSGKIKAENSRKPGRKDSKKDSKYDPKEIENNKRNIDFIKKGKDKNKNKIIAREDYIAILQYFHKHYPSCFPKKDVKPLEVGIRDRLFVLEQIPFSHVKIKKFLRAYTRTKRYKQSLIVGASRVNLAGEETSKVLEQEVNN